MSAVAVKKLTGRINTKKAGVFTKNNDVTNAYYADIRKFSVLSREEEIELFKAYREKGDLNAREKIINSNQRFVVSVANKLGVGKYETYYIDTINEGNIGLVEAVDTFDPTRGCKFITYAVWYIQKEIKNFLMEETSLIKKTNLQKTFYHEEKIREDFRKKNGREIDNSELIEEFSNQHKTKIKDESDLYELNVASIDSPLNFQGDEVSSDYSPVENDLNNTVYVQNDVERMYDEEDNESLTSELMTILLPREKEIIQLFYGFNTFSPYTLDDLAEKFTSSNGRISSRERIRQIIEKSEKKMKIRSKVRRIENIGRYMTILSPLEKVLLNLHLVKKFSPYEISERVVFGSERVVLSPESVQELLCNSIEVVYDFYSYKKKEI